MKHGYFIHDAKIFDHSPLTAQLKKITYIGIVFVIFLIISFALTIFFINSSFNSSYEEKVNTYSKTVSSIINGVVESDTKIINTISTFATNALAMEESISAFNRSSKTPWENEIEKKEFIDNNTSFEYPFCFFTLWKLDDMGNITSPDHRFTMDRVHRETLRAISTAFKTGKHITSIPYYSNIIFASALTYAVPIVDKNGKVQSVITGCKRISYYADIIEALSQNYPDIDPYIVDKHGLIIAFGNNNKTKVLGDSIFDVDIIKDDIDAKNILQSTIETELPNTVILPILDDTYTLSVTEINRNNWKIITLNRKNLRYSPIYGPLQNLTYFITTTFLAVFIISIIIFFRVKHNATVTFTNEFAIAYKDPVTGINNKLRLNDFLQTLDTSIASFAIVAFNIHDFRFINEFSGTTSGDRLLCNIARNALKCQNLVLAARAEADQFFLIFNMNLIDKEYLQHEILALMDRVNKDFNDDLTNIPVVCTAGIAFSKPRDRSGITMLKRVEITSKYITKSYKNKIVFFDDNLISQLAEEHHIKNSMLESLNSNEFLMFLQPKFDLESMKVTSAEALVRWRQKDNTFRYPSTFIPVFEQNGFCIEFDLYMLKKVAFKIREWIDKGIEPIEIAVNQSRLSFFQNNYVNNVKKVIDEANIPAKYIKIEILEDIFAKNPKQIDAYIGKLRQIGVKVALDDFGTGYSSLNLLSAINVDEVKFDRSFLLETDPTKKLKNKVIITNLMELIQGMGYKSVVEGVETKSDVEFLKAIKCNLAQGFYFSKPISAEKFDASYMSKNDACATTYL